MKNSILSIAFLCVTAIGFSQETESKYDEKLAKSLNADDREMKQYVFGMIWQNADDKTKYYLFLESIR